nr:NADH dehydrogenase subunit 3 [Xyloredo sp. E88]UPX89025.1 NADH dehydrogenase subunit 3 [Xyloredo sp. E89]
MRFEVELGLFDWGVIDWSVIFFILGLFVSLLLPVVFSGLWFVMGEKPFFDNFEKKTSFECGFDALSNSWSPFSIRFYIVALLYMVVDIEIILFFCLIFSKGSFFFFFSFFMKFWLVVFLGLLAVALFYEDNEGSLEWKV